VIDSNRHPISTPRVARQQEAAVKDRGLVKSYGRRPVEFVRQN
jgi:hypothetical protein